MNQKVKNDNDVKLQQTHKTKKYKEENCLKTERISLKATKHQKKEIYQMAKQNGLSVNQYMLNRAFEKPQLKFEVGKSIAEMEESINHIYRFRLIMGEDPEKWSARTDCIEGIAEEVKNFRGIFDLFLDSLYKSYLSDIDRASLERREKKLEKKRKALQEVR